MAPLLSKCFSDADAQNELSISPVVGESCRVGHRNDHYVVAVNAIDDAEWKPPHEEIAVAQITQRKAKRIRQNLVQGSNDGMVWRDTRPQNGLLDEIASR